MLAKGMLHRQDALSGIVSVATVEEIPNEQSALSGIVGEVPVEEDEVIPP